MITQLPTKTPIRPGALAVKPHARPGKPRQYAIVSHHRVHQRHGLVGYKQGWGERYAGLYVYNFASWQRAAWKAHEIAASGHPIWEAGE